MGKRQREVLLLTLILYVGGEIALANWFFWRLESMVRQALGLP